MPESMELRTKFDPGSDMCMGFLADAWNTGRIPTLREHAYILELGCAEIDTLAQLREVRPDLHLTGIDQRDCNRPAADRHILGDIFAQQFPPGHFDAILAVSVIEWAGIGHYHDTIRDDGDSEMMRLAHQWLKPDGFLYFDVPYNSKQHMRRNALRAYSNASLEERLYQGLWREESRVHYTGNGHPDGPYVSLVVRPIHGN